MNKLMLNIRNQRGTNGYILEKIHRSIAISFLPLTHEFNARPIFN